MYKIRVFSLVFVLLFMMTLLYAQDETIGSVCLITDVGRVNDGTFNQFAYEGMLIAADTNELEHTFIETQSETDYANNINTCVDEGFDAVVTVGFLIADATLDAAQTNPSVFFIGIDQFVEDGPANYVGIQFREDQSAFLVGSLAALVTETNIVGGVYGVDIPPVVRFRNGFEQGVEFMGTLLDKDIHISGVYIPSFIAPDQGASAATQFIGEGADVLFGGGGPTGSGAITEGAQQDVWVIGVDQDEYFTTFEAGETPGAEKIITSGVKRVDVGVSDMLQVLAEGDMENFPGGGNYILNIANSGMGFAPKNDADIPDVFYEIVSEIEIALAEDTLTTGINPLTTEIEMSVAEIIETTEFNLDVLAMIDEAMMEGEVVEPEATAEADE